MEKISIYLHIPFCKKKCGYCDFLSWVPRAQYEMDKYIDYLLKEIDLYHTVLEEKEIHSIFFGGGTPSMLGHKALVRILKELKKYRVSKDCEITLEANPESFINLDGKKLVKEGFNRLSLGVQSGSQSILKTMERIHTAQEAKEAFLYARECGFGNINVDFISSVPGEKSLDVERSIDWIASMEPDHVSLYSLILEEGSRFFPLVEKGDLVLLGDEVDRQHVHMYQDALENLGYNQYEISNFSRKGFECKHNIGYWTLGDYIGLGLGAHSNLGEKRWWNETSRENYYKKIDGKKNPIKEEEFLDSLDRTNEFVMLGIRMNKGIEAKTILPNGHEFQSFFLKEIEENLKNGLLVFHQGRYCLTDRGRDLANLVEKSFFQLPKEKD